MLAYKINKKLWCYELFHHCLVNVTRLECPAVSDGKEEPVCGRNNRTYPSICHMVQQSDTQPRFSRACNRSDCPDKPVSSQ